MYTSRLKQDKDDDDDNKKSVPDTDYNVMMALEQERSRRAAAVQEQIANRTPEEAQEATEAYRRNLVKCPYCCDVLGRYDILGNDADYVIKEHETDCSMAQQAKREKDATVKIQSDLIVKILNACSIANDFRYAQHRFEKEPAPHHMDNPESEGYRFEREWNENKLDTMSDKLVAAWQGLKELRESSELAMKSFREIWEDQVSTYIDRDGLKMYRMKSFLTI